MQLPPLSELHPLFLLPAAGTAMESGRLLGKCTLVQLRDAPWWSMTALQKMRSQSERKPHAVLVLRSATLYPRGHRVKVDTGTEWSGVKWGTDSGPKLVRDPEKPLS